MNTKVKWSKIKEKKEKEKVNQETGDLETQLHHDLQAFPPELSFLVTVWT